MAAALLLKASMRSESICWLSYPSCLCSSRRLQSRYCTRAVWAAAGSAACKCSTQTYDRVAGQTLLHWLPARRRSRSTWDKAAG